MANDAQSPLLQLAESAATLLALRPVFVQSLSPYTPLVLCALADTTELFSALAIDVSTKLDGDESISQSKLPDEPTSIDEALNSLPTFLQSALEQLRSKTMIEAATLADWSVRAQTYACFLREAATQAAQDGTSS